MPQQEYSHLPNKAVYWPLDHFDAQGQPVVGDPEEIKVRWETTYEIKSDTTGGAGMIVVDRKMAIGSSLWKGELNKWTGARPEEDETGDVMWVTRYDETPDIKGRAVLRTVDVTRSRNSWPNTTGQENADLELSKLTVNKLAADADNLDEISFIVELVSTDGKPIGDRTVRASLSNSTGISYNNSPVDTDFNGVAEIRLRATDPVTTVVTIKTTEDGELFERTTVVFS